MDPLVAEFYDYVLPYKDRKDVTFFVEMAQHSQGPVLEAGCGTGRVLIPTAQAGVEIVGLDLSKSMLSVCQKKLASELQQTQAIIKLVEADMRSFNLYTQFKLVTIPFRGFQHLLTVNDQLSCLSSIHQHLENKGRLVFDLFNPSLERLVDNKYLVEFDEEPAFILPDGRIVVRSHRITSKDLFNQTQKAEWIYHITYHDGHKMDFIYPFQVRYSFRFEVEHLLARAGFHVEEVYADYDRSAYGSKYPGELIFIARKC